MKNIFVIILIFLTSNIFSQGKLEEKIKKGKEVKIKVISNSCLYGKIDTYHFNILGNDSVLVTQTDNEFSISILEFREIENFIKEYGMKNISITNYDLLKFNGLFGKKRYFSGAGSFEKRINKIR